MNERQIKSLMWRHRDITKQKKNLLTSAGQPSDHIFLIVYNREILSIEYQLLRLVPDSILIELQV